MIIFGIKVLLRRMTTILMICRNCNNQAANHLMRRRPFFSLFFIPVIPLGSTYYLTCTYCGKSTKVSKQDAMAIINTSADQNQTQVQPGNIQALPPQRFGPDAVYNPNEYQQNPDLPNLYGNTYPNSPYPPQQYPNPQIPPQNNPNQN